MQSEDAGERHVAVIDRGKWELVSAIRVSGAGRSIQKQERQLETETNATRQTQTSARNGSV